MEAQTTNCEHDVFRKKRVCISHMSEDMHSYQICHHIQMFQRMVHNATH